MRLLAWVLSGSLFSGYSLLVADFKPPPSYAEVLLWTLISTFCFALLLVGHLVLLGLQARGIRHDEARLRSWILFYGVFGVFALVAGGARSYLMASWFGFVLPPHQAWAFALNMTASCFIMIVVLETLGAHRAKMERLKKASEQQASDLIRSRRDLVKEDDRQHQDLAEFLHGTVQSHMVLVWAKVNQACMLYAHDPKVAESLLQETQQILTNLLGREMPLARGLISARESSRSFSDNLKALVRRFQDVLPVEVKGEVSIASRTTISPEMARASLLLIEEAFLNAYRHAAARTVCLSMASQGPASLRVIIQDDGRGFEVSGVRRGIGLSALVSDFRTLGGEWTLESAPGQGTLVTLGIPVRPITEVSRS